MHGKFDTIKIGVFLVVTVFGCLVADYAMTSSARYVGSKACAECHEKEYSNYMKYSKKAHSSESIKVMASDLDPEELKDCYGCHSTGYGELGGFVSMQETPELANAGCEVCHGPGSEHIENDGDTDFIKTVTIEDCEKCHNADRVENFNYKPLIYGGAH